MSNNLPSLVVSLEANMAKFSADMDKAAAKTDQSMLQMAASTQRVQNAIKSLETQSQRGLQAAISLGKGMLLGAAVGMSFDAVKSKVLGVISGMANLKTISEKTGASVENISKLQFFAKQSGSDIDAVAAAMAKMSKGMAGADNDTKGAGLALNYLGLSAKDASGNLKDPAVMIMEVAKRLGEYKDGAGKAAIAQALFGKAGADMLPTLKLMAEQGDIEAKVTTAQATAARQYQRDLAKLDAQKNVLYKTITVALLPSMSDFTNAMVDATRDTNQTNKAVKGLAADNSITEWADNAALGIAALIDDIIFIPKAVNTTVLAIKSLAAAQKVALDANPISIASNLVQGKSAFAGMTADAVAAGIAAKKAKDAADDLWNYDGSKMMKAVQARIDARPKKGAVNEKPEAPKKDLNYNTVGEDGSKQKAADAVAMESSKLAKNVHAGRIKDLEEGQSREQAAMEAANQLMSEARSQDLISVSQYNHFRKESMDTALRSAVDTYDREIAESERYLATLSKGSEREAEQTKIDTLKARRRQALDDGQQRSTMYMVEQTRAQSELNKAAKEFIIQQGDAESDFNFQINMFGRSTLEVNKLTAARRIQLQVEQDVRRAQKEAGTDIPIDRSGYDKAAAEAIAKSNALYDKQDAQQRDPWANAAESVRRYGEEASDTGAQIGSALTSSFRTAEDAFSQFTTTGKLNFKSMASSIIADFARIEARKGMSSLLSLGMGALTSYFGGSVASAGNYSFTPTNLGTSVPFLDTISVAGARATGGSVLGNSAYLVGERGPEIFRPTGAGSITPNSQLGGGGGAITINMELNVADSGTSSQSSGDSNQQARALGELITTKVKETISNERRQGGMLWQMQQGR
jgi:lambda family phage tail tape measure protein